VIHQQYHQILNQTNLDVEFIIVYDSNSLKNKEYTQLLFSKSKKLRDKTILVFNDEKKGYERAVEEIYSKYIDNKSEYKFCTIYKIGYIFNNDNAIEEIKDSLENNNMIVHSVFNESDPFHISRDIITEFLPVSWVLKSKKMMEEILEKHEFSENEQNLFRKLKL
jgi:hypothetical protein